MNSPLCENGKGFWLSLWYLQTLLTIYFCFKTIFQRSMRSGLGDVDVFLSRSQCLSPLTPWVRIPLMTGSISYFPNSVMSVNAFIYFITSRMCSKSHLSSYEYGRILSYRQECMFEVCFHEKKKREWMDRLLSNSIISVDLCF